MFYNLFCSLKIMLPVFATCFLYYRGLREASAPFGSKLAALTGLFGTVSPFTCQRKEPTLNSVSWKSLCLEGRRDLGNITL